MRNTDKGSSKTEKNGGLFDRVREKIRTLHDKEERLQEFLRSKSNQKTLRLIKRETFRLLRHISPRKFCGRVYFGFDDPYTTGQVLTYLSPFYAFYAEKLDLIPVFEEQRLEGKAEAAGRVRLAVLLWILVRLAADKNIRRWIRKFRER